MKLKGVNPIAQHIEKVVLGLTVLIFLAVISMQFVTSPNNVKAGSRDVAPDQIYNELASTANALQSQISDTSPSLPQVQRQRNQAPSRTGSRVRHHQGARHHRIRPNQSQRCHRKY
jgi:hypothetical protein